MDISRVRYGHVSKHRTETKQARHREKQRDTQATHRRQKDRQRGGDGETDHDKDRVSGDARCQ